MNVPGRLAALRDRMGDLADPQQRLSWVVHQVRLRPPFPAEGRTDDHRVPGCAARLWLVARLDEGRCHFVCDSDSAILKALAGLLADLYDGLPAAEVASDTTNLPQALGIDNLLTENRRRTLRRLGEAIREFAKASCPPPG